MFALQFFTCIRSEIILILLSPRYFAPSSSNISRQVGGCFFLSRKNRLKFLFEMCLFLYIFCFILFMKQRENNFFAGSIIFLILKQQFLSTASHTLNKRMTGKKIRNRCSGKNCSFFQEFSVFYHPTLASAWLFWVVLKNR